jgi:hypothetical protein
MAIGSKEQGCDLNDDDVVDNKLSKVTSIYKDANVKMQEAIDKGDLVLLFEPAPAYKSDGTAFDMNMLVGKVDPTDKACGEANKPGCKYTVATMNYDLTSKAAICPSLVTFPGTKVEAGKIKAGGPNQVFNLNLEFQGISLKLVISKASFTGKVSGGAKWETTTEGLVCGLIRKEDLDKAIDAVPEELLQEAGLDKATVKSLIITVLKPDIDTDGKSNCLKSGKPCVSADDCATEDGTCTAEDAISVGLLVDTVAAIVTGITPADK